MEKIRKADVVLIAACMLTAVLVGVFLMVFRHEGNGVRISCDGELIAEIAFEATGTQRYFISAKDGRMMVESCEGNPVLSDKGAYNLLSIEAGMVRMEAADCRDQICVRHHAVSAEGESIICLPHRLVVEITTVARHGRPIETERPGDREESSQETVGRNGAENQMEDSDEATEEALDGVVE